MRRLLGSVLLCFLLLFGCNETHDGMVDAGVEVDSAIHCDPCEDAIQLRIEGVSNPEDIVVEGAELTCMDASPFIYCGIREFPPGEYSLTVSAAGFIPQMLFFSLGEPNTLDGCTCPSTFSRLVRLRPM
jgi:hypothetical protein